MSFKQFASKRAGLMMGFILGSLTLAVSTGAPHAGAQLPAADQVGRWTDPIDWPIVPIHTLMLPNGKVMATQKDGQTILWNPVTDDKSTPPLPNYNIFCMGHSFLADGRVLVTGGHIEDAWGPPNASIYDPFNNSWTPLPDMNFGRWYPTNTTLANGEVVVIAGSYKDNAGTTIHVTIPQVWTGRGWRDLTNASYRHSYYPRNHLAPNGKVFKACPSATTQYIDTAGTGLIYKVASNKAGNRDAGTSVLYGDGLVLAAGGADPPLNTAEVIDLNAAKPAWRLVNSMAFPRRQHNATLLPDGTVLVTGGISSSDGDLTPGTEVLAAELWNPVTETWKTLSSAQKRRPYHSIALLLPDGRVLTGGGGLGKRETIQRNIEIYSPPYLFKGPRPVIVTAPESVGYGETFFVETPDAARITNVNWLRLGTVTHASDMDQRINRLSFTAEGNGLKVTAPSKANLCPPGYYMLFILNGEGVPSEAHIVRIGGPGGQAAPWKQASFKAALLNNTSIKLTWVDSSGDEDGYTLQRSTDGITYADLVTLGVNAQAYTNTGLAEGTKYTYRIRAFNRAGTAGWSTASATTPGSVPAAPGNLTGTAVSSSRIDLAWVDNSTNETGFKIYRSTDGVSFSIAKTLGANVTSFSDTGRSAATPYTYYVLAYNSVGNSGASNTITLKTLAAKPAAPSGLTAKAVSSSRIDLAWVDNSTNETGFKVYRSTDGVSFATAKTLEANVTSYSDTGRSPGTTYYYQVRAYNATGNSSASNTASATTP